jgi:hypothetical protein
MSLANTIIYGDESDVLQILRSGADVNEIDEYGFRPLIEAAICNKPGIAKILLEQGAEVDQVDSTGRTALFWAVENNNLVLVRLLLNNGANVNHYTQAGQPILVTPILRNQTKLKNLLYDFNADLNFALDYINTKLLGHRFELVGQADIVDPSGRFVALDFEGFFLEFTLGIILQSLERYRNNFASRHLRKYFKYVKYLIDAFTLSTYLIKYQQYTINLDHHQKQIDQLLNHELLIIPVAHRGHAITFIRYANLWAKCDRGANSVQEGSINIYKVNNRRQFNNPFFKALIYQRQPPEFIASGYKKLLDAQVIMRLPLASQITGNCSWSNVEAAIPTILFLLMTEETNRRRDTVRQCIDEALHFYQEWQEWDKDRALQECISGFNQADRVRKASKASILGAVLFQCCHYLNAKDVERAEKILPLLAEKDYRYVLESYLDIYWRRNKTIPGNNLIHLLDACGLSWY